MLYTNVYESQSTGSEETDHIWATKPSGHEWTTLYKHIFISLYLKASIQNLVTTVISDKKKQQCFILTYMYMTFDQSQIMTLSLNIFIFSSSCLHLSMFRPQAAIVSKKSTYRKDYVPKFDLAVK